MKTNNVESKYRILVVKDQSKYFQIALKNAVNLAKKIGGSIDVLFVKSPSQVVNNENQLAAWRNIRQESGNAKMDIKKVVDLVTETEQIPVSHHFAYGNVINEVQQYITNTNPDIVVLGKPSNKVKGMLGLDLTSYLLTNYQGALLISSDEQVVDSHEDIALGLIGDFMVKGKSQLTEDLEKCTSKPITLLKVNNSSDKKVQSDVARHGMTTFEFDKGVNIANSIAKYIERCGINLLCVKRNQLLDLSKKIKTPVLVLAS